MGDIFSGNLEYHVKGRQILINYLSLNLEINGIFQFA